MAGYLWRGQFLSFFRADMLTINVSQYLFAFLHSNLILLIRKLFLVHYHFPFTSAIKNICKAETEIVSFLQREDNLSMPLEEYILWLQLENCTNLPSFRLEKE
jgi:hypothetical protein